MNVSFIKFIISFHFQRQKKPVGESEYETTQVNIFVDKYMFLYSLHTWHVHSFRDVYLQFLIF